jgi:nicotinate-nucleotide pyrophosphorylase (carboxylating)
VDKQRPTVSSFTPPETAACRRLVELALAEDLGGVGDLTSQAVIPANLEGRAVFVARVPGVLAGMPAVALVLGAVEPRLQLERHVEDGTTVKPGDRLATVSGPMRGILAAERTALNFLQHLSGIATLTRHYVDAVAGLRAQILDTRKTLPGWRVLDKYAVRQGGGHNHRMGLFDGILIKDNHLAARQQGVRAVAEQAQAWREQQKSLVPLEIEVDTLDQLDEVLGCRPDIVLLDNMTTEQLREAVRRRNDKAPGVVLEASGGITLANVRAVAETGVERISVGALTHSAPALDIALDYLP